MDKTVKRSLPLDFEFLRQTQQEEFTDENYQTSSSSVSLRLFKKFRYLCVLAKIQGCLPLQKLSFRTKSTKDLKYKRLSLIYIFSILCLLFKVTFLIAIFSNSNSDQNVQDLFNTTSDTTSKSSATSLIIQSIAESASIGLTYFFGFIAHVIILRQTKPFLQLIQLLEDFETRFPSKFLNIPSIWGCKVNLSIFSSLFTLTCAVFFIYESSFYNSSIYRAQESAWVPTVVGALSRLTIIIIIEYGTLFLYIQLFYMGRVIRKMISDITDEINVEVKCNSIPSSDRKLGKSPIAGEVDINEFTAVWNTQSLLHVDKMKMKPNLWAKKVESKMKWAQLGDRYFRLTEIFEAYEKFASPYLTVTPAFLIVSTVFTIFVIMTKETMGEGGILDGPDFFHWSVQVKKIFYRGVTSIACEKILLIASLGEEFKNEYSNLVKIMSKYRLYQDLDGTDGDEFNMFRQLVESLPIKLSAGGYFIVCKKNVTSIASVIITYLVVLWQFKTSN